MVELITAFKSKLCIPYLSRYSTDACDRGAFDISFLASIASHLAYWTDEDVSHFIISQLLSKQRLVRKSQSATALRG